MLYMLDLTQQPPVALMINTTGRPNRATTKVGILDRPASTPTHQVYRNGDWCKGGRLWSAVVLLQCDPAKKNDSLVAATHNTDACQATFTVATPRACLGHCRSPPPPSKIPCGTFQLPKPAPRQAVLNLSATNTDDPPWTTSVSYFASPASSTVQACRPSSGECLQLGTYSGSAAADPRKQSFYLGGDLCDAARAKRYTTDVWWVCAPGARRDNLVVVSFNDKTCRSYLVVQSAKACVSGVRCPSPPPPRRPPPRKPPPRRPPPRRPPPRRPPTRLS